MNDHTSLEERLRGLAEYLNKGTNVAPQVMRAVQRIAADPGVGRSATRPTLLRSASYAAALAVAVALLAILLFVWGDRQSVAWAQVVRAVAQKPWLHATTTLPDGKKAEFDLWFSANRAVMARRAGKGVWWSDFEQKTTEYYDSRENTIVRASDDEVREGSGLYEAMFKAFLSTEVEHTIAAGRFTLIHQRQRVVNEEGRHWIEHHFRLQFEKESMQEWVVYVNPDTHLPFRWEQSFERTDVDHIDPSKTAVFRFDIDYPEMGPANIYALGVPKNAKVVDRLVDPARTDVKRLIAEIKAARWRSDKYYALVVEGDDNQHWWEYFPTYRVWRSGARWRVERSFGYDVRQRGLPPKGADPATWWSQKAEKVRFVPSVRSDGTWVWEYMTSGRLPTQADIDAGAPKDKTFLASNEKRRHGPTLPPGTDKGEFIDCADDHPEYLARPLPYLRAPDYIGVALNEAKLDPKPASGPPNTVLLEVHNSHWTPGGYHPQMWRYWIDPQRGYLVMRYEELIAKEGKQEIVRGHAIEGVIQDPGGQWYPTVIRLFKRNVLMGSDKPPYDGIMRCYYDFATPMPESLFTAD
jgi:hypothetical protein